MRAERWRRLKTIFEGARMRRGTRREAYLGEACADDVALRGDIESLLCHQPTTDRWRASLVPVSTEPTATGPPEVERCLGPYRLLRLVGRGGMGDVYLAERQDGAYQQRVAIKRIHPWMTTGDLAERLRQERQILAGLRHPAIVSLLDGGTTEDGTPYLVMDFVDGRSIDRYCDRQQLSPRQRVALLLPVCRAVHHAHRKLVVHRDLKPANILVSAEGQPFLLDFGIATVLNQGVGALGLDETGRQYQRFTPSYASPEQLAGDAVTTATDVYALGALLYRLLAGSPPFGDLAGVPSDEARRIVRTPPRPPSEADGQRRSRRDRRLATDLDAIVEKAMMVDPEARYASVERLHEDLENALAGRPVHARLGVPTYRLGAFLWRHRIGLATGGTAVGVLMATTLILAGHARTAERLENDADVARAHAEAFAEQARSERERAEEISAFLLGLFDPEPGQDTSTSLDAEAVVARGLDRIADRPGTSNASRAALFDTLGRVSLELGHLDRAAELLDRALVLRRLHLGPDHPDVARSLHHLANLHRTRGELPVAESLLRQAVDIALDSLGTNHPMLAELYHALGRVRRSMDDLDEAETAFRQALALERVQGSSTLGAPAELLLELGELMTATGRLDEGRSLIQRSLGLRRKRFGEDHAEVARALRVLGRLEETAGRLPRAESLLRRSLEIHRRARGARSIEAAATSHELGIVRYRRGRLQEADAILEEALATREAIFGRDHFDVADTLSALGLVRRELDAFPEALAAYQRALAIYREVCGVGSQAEATVLNELGLVHLGQGDLDAAETVMQRAYGTRRNQLHADDPRVGSSELSLGELRAAQGRHREAQAHFVEALAIFTRGLGAAHWRSGRAESLLGETLEHLGEREEGARRLRAGLETLTASLGEQHLHTRRVREHLTRMEDATATPSS